MSHPDQSTPAESIFTTAVALFLVPAYLYLCSYVFEMGSCSFYRIPNSLIVPDLSTNLFYTVTFSTAFIIIYFLPQLYINWIFQKKLKDNEAFYPFIRINSVVFVAFTGACFLASYEIDWIRTGIALVASLIVGNALAYLEYSYIHEKLKNGEEYNRVALEWNRNMHSSVPILNTPDIFHISWFFKGMRPLHKNVILLCTGMIVISYFVGKRFAFAEHTYSVSTESKDFVLLKKYGDNLILKNFDSNTNILGDTIIIWKVAQSITGNKFVIKHIGQLKTGQY